MDIRVSKLDTMRVVCMEHIGPYNEIGPVFHKLWNFTQQHSLPVEGEKWIGIYRDDPSSVPQEKLRSEACVTVGIETEIPDLKDITVKTLDGGKYAIGTHVGPYSGLGAAWGDIWADIEKAGHEVRNSPCFELYISGGDDGIPESEWVTELCIPVE